MIYEKGFQFPFIGFIFLQLLYMNWYLIIQSNSYINYTFFNRDLYYKVWYVNPYLSLYYEHVLVYFFILRIYTSQKKHSTSDTYNEVTISILQSLNSCLQDVPVPPPYVLLITLLYSLNIDILSLCPLPPRKLYHILLAIQILNGKNFLSYPTP